MLRHASGTGAFRRRRGGMSRDARKGARTPCSTAERASRRRPVATGRRAQACTSEGRHLVRQPAMCSRRQACGSGQRHTDCGVLARPSAIIAQLKGGLSRTFPALLCIPRKKWRRSKEKSSAQNAGKGSEPGTLYRLEDALPSPSPSLFDDPRDRLVKRKLRRPLDHRGLNLKRCMGSMYS